MIFGSFAVYASLCDESVGMKHTVFAVSFFNPPIFSGFKGKEQSTGPGYRGFGLGGSETNSGGITCPDAERKGWEK